MLASSSVFHSPQASHLPDHLELLAPQAVHAKARWDLTIALTFLIP